MLVKGLTPCASILCALTKYRWKKNYNPEILHFYWIVRQNEIESFQWLVHMLTDISFELKTGKENGQIEGKYYCEINVYVTGCEKKPVEVPAMHRALRPLGECIRNLFLIAQFPSHPLLYEAVLAHLITYFNLHSRFILISP